MKTNNPIPIRRKARSWALCLLYQWEIRENELTDTMLNDFEAQIQELEQDLEPREKNKILKLTMQHYRGVLFNLAVIDRILIECSHNWKLQRMASVDRNIMRIAVYEMLFQDDIPEAVSINEAIEIAKVYGSEDSWRFVNGILDRIGKNPKLLHHVEA